MKTKGFTLVELLVVIAILAILATVSVVGYTQYINNANATTLTTDAENLESIIEAELILDDQSVQIGDAVYVKRTSTGVVICDANGAAIAVGTNITLTQGQFKQFSDKGYTVTVKSANTLEISSTKVTNGVVITLD